MVQMTLAQMIRRLEKSETKAKPEIAEKDEP